MADSIDDLTDAERADLRREMLAKIAERNSKRGGESVPRSHNTTPIEDTQTKIVTSPLTSSSDPYGLPTLEEGLAHRFGVTEEKAKVTKEQRQTVIEKTLKQFNSVWEQYGASPVVLDKTPVKAPVKEAFGKQTPADVKKSTVAMITHRANTWDDLLQACIDAWEYVDGIENFDEGAKDLMNTLHDAIEAAIGKGPGRAPEGDAE